MVVRNGNSCTFYCPHVFYTEGIRLAPGCNKGCESDIPFCLAFGEQVECTGSVNKPHSILARNLPELAGSEEENAMFRAADAEDIPYCQVFNDSRVRCSSSIKPPTENRDFHLATSAGSDNDEDMFKAADVNGVGYFTYDQFLAHTNSTNDVPTTLYFQKYVWLVLLYCGLCF